MFTFSELQDEVKRSAVKDKAGTGFDTSIKNAINRAIYRISREGKWRSLRRKDSFDTEIAYSEGTGAVSVTEDSKEVTVTGATFITDGIEVGRRIDLGGSNKPYRIETITGEETLTVNMDYDGDTSTEQDYSIYAQGTYALPIQSSHNVILWHEQWGNPTQLRYVSGLESIGNGEYEDETNVPTWYRMWDENGIITQLRQASIVSVVSSSTNDTTQSVTVYGTVSGYPDFETLSLNGTTTVNGSKSFSEVERVVASSNTRTGRITVSGNSGEDTISVLPVGNTTRQVVYKKIDIRPLPSTVFPMFVYYYKQPYMLVNDGDVHVLGSDFDSAIVYLATAIVRGENSQKEASTYMAMYIDEIKNLRKFHLDKIDWLPKLKSELDSHSFGPRVARNVLYSQIGNKGMYGPQ